MKAKISFTILLTFLLSHFYIAQTSSAAQNKKYFIYRQKLILEDSPDVSSDDILKELRQVAKSWHDSVKVYKEGKEYVEDFYVREDDKTDLRTFSQHFINRITGFYVPYQPEKIKPIIEKFTNEITSNYIPVMQIQNNSYEPFLLATFSRYADQKTMETVYTDRLYKKLPTDCIPVIWHNKDYSKWSLTAIQYNLKERNFINTTMFDKVEKNGNKITIYPKKEYWNTIETIIRKNPYSVFVVVQKNFSLIANLYKDGLSIKKGKISVETSSPEIAEEFYTAMSRQYTQYKFLISYQNIHKL